jgi:bifunctional DNase/RNase
MDTMLEAEIWTIARIDEGTAAVLHPLGTEIAVPIFIGQNEAQAILLGFGEVAVPRPLTHDLLLDLANKQGLTLLRAEISDIRDGIFYARLVFSAQDPGNKPLILDSRPSDALALAVRCKCPLFIARNVVDQAGLPVEFFLDALGETISADTVEIAGEGIAAHRTALRMELDQAVADEEYERAAEIRDALALLNRGKEK